VDTAFAQPEQILGLADLMVRHGWSDAAVRGALGLNWARAAAAAWCKPTDMSQSDKPHDALILGGGAV
jgi:hypothetical protein